MTSFWDILSTPHYNFHYIQFQSSEKKNSLYRNYRCKSSIYTEINIIYIGDSLI